MEEKYLLWASDKDYHHNSPVFWGKNNSGYYSTLEDCQLYTLEEALKYASEDTIPVKLSELMKCSKTTFVDTSKILNEAMKEYSELTHECTSCARLTIETCYGVCDKYGILNNNKVNCKDWIKE